MAGGSLATSGALPFCTYHATPIVSASTAATPRYALVLLRFAGTDTAATGLAVAASGDGATTDTLAGADFAPGMPEAE